jgi:hypothetical protein
MTKTSALILDLVRLTAILWLASPLPAVAQKDSGSFANVKQWKAEVVVTSDCDRLSADGSRTVIHNRITTTYEFARRVTGPRVATWSGRGSTTYRWLVGTELRDRRDVEESSASFETDAKLELGESIKISVGRVPGRPFTRTKYVGETAVEKTTSDDEPPAAELFDAPLPSDSGVATGERDEAGYSLFGGLVLTCPAHRQWTIRAGS